MAVELLLSVASKTPAHPEPQETEQEDRGERLDSCSSVFFFSAESEKMSAPINEGEKMSYE